MPQQRLVWCPESRHEAIQPAKDPHTAQDPLLAMASLSLPSSAPTPSVSGALHPASPADVVDGPGSHELQSNSGSEVVELGKCAAAATTSPGVGKPTPGVARLPRGRRRLSSSLAVFAELRCRLRPGGHI